MPQCLPREKREAEVADLGLQDRLPWLCQEAISTWECAKGTQISPNCQDTIFHVGYSREINCHSLKDPLVTRWIKIASQWFLPAQQCIFHFARALQGRKVLASQTLMDHTIKLVLGHLKDPFGNLEKVLLFF